MNDNNRIFTETYRAFSVSELKTIVFDLGWHSDEYPNIKTPFVHQLLYNVANTQGCPGRFVKAAIDINQSFAVSVNDPDWKFYAED